VRVLTGPSADRSGVAAPDASLGRQETQASRTARGYRCALTGAPPCESAEFAAALDEALSPIARPRYVIAHWTASAAERGWWASLRAAGGHVQHRAGLAPRALGVGANARRAQAYARA
jgi:hypothetical protein